MKKEKLFIIAAILITLFIFGNSIMPAEYSDAGSDFFVEKIKTALEKAGTTFRPGKTVVVVRKTAHVLEFALQGFLIAGCFSGKFRNRIVNVLFSGLLTACIDEFIQLFPKGRSSMVQDVFFDFSGTIIGLSVFFCVYKLMSRKKA